MLPHDHHEHRLAVVLVELEQRLELPPVEQEAIPRPPAPCPASVGVPLLRLCTLIYHNVKNQKNIVKKCNVFTDP